MSGARAAEASEALGLTSMIAWLGRVPRRAAGERAMYRTVVFFSDRVTATVATSLHSQAIHEPKRTPMDPQGAQFFFFLDSNIIKSCIFYKKDTLHINSRGCGRDRHGLLGLTTRS